MRIRPANPNDAAEIARIYNYYVDRTVITFEETAVSAESMEARMAEIAQQRLPWLVADDNGIAGYAYASPWKARSAYRFSVEATIYVANERVGQGVGTALYQELIAALRARGDIHAVIGGIALPNDASVALHERLGMTKVAHFKEVGFKFGRWVDVAYWQLTLSDARGS
jgi:L-amino acid N-acyltransferase YncA